MGLEHNAIGVPKRTGRGNGMGEQQRSAFLVLAVATPFDLHCSDHRPQMPRSRPKRLRFHPLGRALSNHIPQHYTRHIQTPRQWVICRHAVQTCPPRSNDDLRATTAFSTCVLALPHPALDRLVQFSVSYPVLSSQIKEQADNVRDGLGAPVFERQALKK